MQKAYRILVLFILALPVLPSVAADWTYRVQIDGFEGQEVRTAVLQAENGAGALQVLHTSKGAKVATISSRTPFDCFPRCEIRIKFDAAAPITVAATSQRLVSSTITLIDYQAFEALMLKSQIVTIRAAHVSHASDIQFQIAQSFDPSKWDVARTLQQKEARCKENAVVENYSVCMKRE